jgi:hypothetical protein
LENIKGINLKNQVQHLVGLFSALIFGSVFLLVSYNDETLSMFIYLLVCVSLIIIIGLFIHLQYYFLNRNVKILIQEDDTIRYFKNEMEINVTQDLILKIEKNGSNSFYSSHWLLPTDSYNYSKIFLKNGDIILITSLIISDFNLFSEKVNIKKRIIAFID